MPKIKALVREIKENPDKKKDHIEEIYNSILPSLKRLVSLFPYEENFKKDLIQEGFLALDIAIEKFDLDRNINFNTYYFYWAKKRIFDFATKNRFPFSISQHYNATRGEINLIELDEMTDCEIEQNENKTDEHERNMFNLDKFLKELPPEEQAIIKSRYGIETPKKTLREMSVELNSQTGKVFNRQKSIEDKLRVKMESCY